MVVHQPMHQTVSVVNRPLSDAINKNV